MKLPSAITNIPGYVMPAIDIISALIGCSNFASPIISVMCNYLEDTGIIKAYTELSMSDKLSDVIKKCSRTLESSLSHSELSFFREISPLLEHRILQISDSKDFTLMTLGDQIVSLLENERLLDNNYITYSRLTEISNMYLSIFQSEMQAHPDLQSTLNSKRLNQVHEMLMKFNIDISNLDARLTALEQKNIVTHKSITRNYNLYVTEHFLGRTEVLSDITAKAQVYHRILVSGMGGIGKTQLCRKLYNLLLNDPEYEAHYAYVGYIEYSGNLEMDLYDHLQFNKTGKYLEDIEALWQQLELLGSNGRTLLIVDDINHLSTSQKHIITEDISKISMNCDVILATRNRDIDGYYKILLSFLKEDECVRLFRDIYGFPISADEEKMLFHITNHVVGRNTLAIELLAKNARASIQSITTLAEKFNPISLESGGDDEKIAIILKEVFATAELTDFEIFALQVFSLVPDRTLGIDCCVELILDTSVCSEDTFKRNLMQLSNKGWLQCFIEDQIRFSVHPVIASIITLEMPFSYSQREAFVDRLTDTWQKDFDNLANGQLLREVNLIYYYEAVLLNPEFIKSEDDDDSLVFIYWALGFMYYSIEHYSESLKLLEKVDADKADEFSWEPHDYYNFLGNVYSCLGDYRNALRNFDIALSAVSDQDLENILIYRGNRCSTYYLQGEYQKTVDEAREIIQIAGDHTNDTIIEVYNYWGNSLVQLARFSEAKEIFIYILEIITEDDELFILVKNNLAQCYIAEGDFAKAIDVFHQLIEIASEDPCDIDSLALFHNNLGTAYVEFGDSDLGRPHLLKALQFWGEDGGNFHHLKLLTFSNLCCCMLYKMQYNSALFWGQKGVELLELIGSNHPNAGLLYCNMSQAYLGVTQYNEAINTAQKALSILTDFFDEDAHPLFATIYDTLGSAYVCKGNFEQGIQFSNKALELLEKYYGHKHIKTAQINGSVGLLYYHDDRYDEALDYISKALHILEENASENHFFLTTLYSSMADIYKKQQKFDLAIDLTKKELSLQKRVLGEKDGDTVEIYDKLARLYSRIQDYKNSIMYYKKLYDIQQDISGNHNELSGEYAYIIGGQYMLNMENIHALYWFNKALTIREEIFGDCHEITVATLFQMAELYFKLEKYADSLRLIDRALYPYLSFQLEPSEWMEKLEELRDSIPT